MPAMNSVKRSLLIAAIAADCFLLTSGVGYRLLFAQLARPVQSTPLPRGTLAQLPLRLGPWQGRDVPLDPAIRKATEADDLVNRVYTLRNGPTTVGFYIAYGIRARDLMPHRPEVCYPGNGWTLQSSTEERIALPDNSSLPCRTYRFRRGGLETTDLAVLNYYLIDGRYSPDVSLLRARAWRGPGTIHYVAQIQITASRNASTSTIAIEEAVRHFAAASAPTIRHLLPKEETAIPPRSVHAD